jgi:hypothetical protein
MQESAPDFFQQITRRGTPSARGEPRQKPRSMRMHRIVQPFAQRSFVNRLFSRGPSRRNASSAACRKYSEGVCNLPAAPCAIAAARTGGTRNVIVALMMCPRSCEQVYDDVR